MYKKIVSFLIVFFIFSFSVSAQQGIMDSPEMKKALDDIEKLNKLFSEMGMFDSTYVKTYNNLKLLQRKYPDGPDSSKIFAGYQSILDATKTVYDNLKIMLATSADTINFDTPKETITVDKDGKEKTSLEMDNWQFLLWLWSYDFPKYCSVVERIKDLSSLLGGS